MNGRNRDDLYGNTTIVRQGTINKHNHVVRNPIESCVCEWLMQRNIAHRHAPEIFTVMMRKGRYETYSPDIVLHDRKGDRGVIIETFHPITPRRGGTTLLANFRSRATKQYYVILVAPHYTMGGINKGAFDLLVDSDRLEEMENEIPQPPEDYFNDVVASGLL